MTGFLPFHSRRVLTAYVENRLGAARRARLERHLAGCAACREREQRLRATMARLEAWRVESPPPALGLASLVADSGSNPGFAPLSRWWPRFVVAGLVVAVAGALVVLAGRERLELVHASDALSVFENMALAEHAALRSASPSLALASRSASEIREWLKSQGGFSADLLDERTASEHRFELLGVRSAVSSRGLGSVRGAAIVARIDELPVTLLVGHAKEIDGLPSWSLFGKQLQVRRITANGTHLLSWKNAGKAYSLVADSALAPKLACQLCHASPRRLATIERVAGEL